MNVSAFGAFEIHNFLIKDHHKDTLIYAQDITGVLDRFDQLKNKKLFFKNVSATNTWVRDKTYREEASSSLSIFSKSFKTKKKNEQPLQLTIQNIYANALRYVKIKHNKSIVDFKNIGGHVAKLDLLGLDVKVKTDSLSFVDVYGIHYKKLKTNFDYNLHKMSFGDTEIVTDHSNLHINAIFEYLPEDFVEFVKCVKVKGVLKESVLSLKDIHKIYPHYKDGKTFNVKSEVSGTLNDLMLKNTELDSEDELIKIKGDFKIANSIADRDIFWAEAVNSNFKLNSKAFKNLIPDQYHESLPQKLYRVEELGFKGDLYTSRKLVKVNGQAITSIGSSKIKGFVNHINKHEKKIKLNFDHGILKKNEVLKNVRRATFSGMLKGNVSSKISNLKGDFQFKKIDLDNISIANSFLKFKTSQKETIANFSTTDSLISFDTNIKYQNNKKEGISYEVDFDVLKAKLSKLFPEKTSYQDNVSGKGSIDIVQFKNNFMAKGVVKDLHIKTPNDSLNLNDVLINVRSTGQQKEIALNSKELLNLSVDGEFNFSDFEKLVINALYKFIPGSSVRSDVENQIVNFGLDVYPEFLKSLTNKIALQEKLKVSGVLDANGDKGIIIANIPSVASNNLKIDSLKVVLDNSNKWINSNISATQLSFKKQVYKNVSLLGKKINDTLFVRSNFNSKKIANRAIFNLTTQDETLIMGIENVYLKFLTSTWLNKKGKENKIYYHYKTGNWDFSEVAFGNKEQEFEFGGAIKKESSKNLKLSLKNIKLSEFLPGIDSLSVAGIASGDVYFKENNKLLRPNGNLTVKGLKINGIDYGLMKTSIYPNTKELGYDLNFNISNKDTDNIDAKGEITIDEDNFLASDLNLDVHLNNLKLNSLSPLGRNVLSAIRGNALGDFTVSGKINDFNTYGKIKLVDSGLKFPYLNTNYNLIESPEVILKGKEFVFKEVKLEDVLYKTKGVLSGKIDYDKHNNWNLDLRIDSQNLMVMDIEQKENSKYFGTGFMDGFATIKGPTSDLKINVSGKTLKNTRFVLPISDVKEVAENRFIYYKTDKSLKKEDNQEQEIAKQTGGVSLLLNLEITKDAIGEVVIDQTSGSSLLGSVDGRMLIDIDKLFNIKMYGDLVVDHGQYNFKYGGVINKPFEIKKGGTVSWSGDPYKAKLNIEAVHRVKSNPKVLLENLTVNRKIDVDLVTKVSGELFNSSQDFLIKIPNASSTVASELDFKLNLDKNSKMRQFFSLLVSKTFFDDNNINSTGAVLSNTTSELISNAVTDIFNKEGGKLHVNFGYTSGESSDVEDFSDDDQIDIGLATEINERVLINGKLGVPVGANTQSAVVGEVKIEFLLNKEGTLRSSVFNRQNEIQYSEEEQGYTQGLGLNYQINFNNLTEMLQKLKLKKSKEKETED